MGPLIVAVNGAAGIGVTSACQRLYHALKHKYKIKVVALPVHRDVYSFELAYLAHKYDDYDIVIMDRHSNVTSVINKQLKNSLFTDDSICPDISFVLCCHYQTYRKRVGNTNNKTFAIINGYSDAAAAIFGTDNHHRVSVEGDYGHLSACGDMLRLINKAMEHRYATHAVT